MATVSDADANSEDATKQICNILRKVGLPIPSQPLQIASSDHSRTKTCFLIVPHNLKEGMLEDVCLESVHHDPALQCVDEYLACIHQLEIPQPRNRSKARIHAFLASRERPDLRLGEAADAKILELLCRIVPTIEAVTEALVTVPGNLGISDPSLPADRFR